MLAMMWETKTDFGYSQKKQLILDPILKLFARLILDVYTSKKIRYLSK